MRLDVLASLVCLLTAVLAAPMSGISPPILTTEPPGPARNQNLFRPGMLAFITGLQHTPGELALMSRFVREAQEVWLRLMEQEVWWSSHPGQTAKRRELDGGGGSDTKELERRLRRHKKKFQWVQDCKKFVEIAETLAEHFLLPVNPLAIFPEWELSYCDRVNPYLPSET